MQSIFLATKMSEKVHKSLRVASGKWQVASGRWQVPCGSWLLPVGEWQVEAPLCTPVNNQVEC